MTVSVDQDQNAGASLDVSLYKALDLKPEVKVSEKTNSSIEVSEPRYIGFKAVAIIDWIPTNQLGAETATVSGKLLTADQVNKIIGQ